MSHPDDQVGYSAYCKKCGRGVTWANMYGMFTCPDCGFRHNPAFPEAERKANEDWKQSQAVEARTLREGAKLVEKVELEPKQWSGRWDELPS